MTANASLHDDFKDGFHPVHWEDLLTSGLTPETIQAHGIYSARPNDIPKLLVQLVTIKYPNVRLPGQAPRP